MGRSGRLGGRSQTHARRRQVGQILQVHLADHGVDRNHDVGVATARGSVRGRLATRVRLEEGLDHWQVLDVHAKECRLPLCAI